jgi:DNA-binding response OmpR family regulator
MSKIVLIEDEPLIAEFIKSGLERFEFSVSVFENGNEGYLAGKYGDFDLMILDIGIPGINGVEVLKKLRGEGHQIPIIILTARDSLTDRVSGLDLGANDYMAKPFEFPELLARVRLRLNESKGRLPSSQRQIQYRELTMDLDSRYVTVDGREINLSPKEFRILEIFLQSKHRVVTREFLLNEVWGFDFDPTSNVVDVYVSYLRNKIPFKIIETIRGSGYRLVRLQN